MPDKLVGSIGCLAVGDRFWGRENELEQLLELIVDCENVSIIAPRRIGKTSLMHKASDHLPPDFVALHIDVQAARSAADLITGLAVATRSYEGMWNKVKSSFGNLFKVLKDNIDTIGISDLKIKIRAGIAEDNWQDKGNQIMEVLADHDKRVVLFIDELPIMISRMLEDEKDGKKAVDSLLSWLRAKALEHRCLIHFVFAGSIGLEPVLNRVGLTAHINHLAPLILRPWDNQTALECLKALAAYCEMDLPDAAALKMIDLLGCNIPHHVQLFFAKAREYCKENNLPSCSPDTVEQVFKRRMLSTQGHTDLVHMEERLEKVFNEKERVLAVEILTQISIKGYIENPGINALCNRCRVPQEERRDVLPRLFRILEHDGYLRTNQAGRFVFESNWLREWWKARNEAFFETV